VSIIICLLARSAAVDSSKHVDIYLASDSKVSIDADPRTETLPLSVAS